MAKISTTHKRKTHSMYKLSANLKGHEQDVKSVVAINDSQVASCSRDGTVRVWSNNDGVWNGVIAHNSEKFINSLCYDKSTQLLFYGGQDTLVGGISPLATTDEDPVYMLIGHKGNVCSLSSKNNFVISSSWDKTAKVWHNGSAIYDLVGHSASVWDAKFLPEKDFFLTASADCTIKLWHGNKLIKTFSGIHKDVVRHLDISPDGETFASCSNDGTVKINDMDGNILKTFTGHESFVYSVKFLPNGDLVSCGEDRSVRVWSKTGAVKQVLRLPAVSIWDLDILPNGDILVGSSDNMVRIFTVEESRIASNSELEELQKQVENSSINSQTMDFDESKLSPYEVILQPGKKEGQVAVVKAPSGAIEAHQFSQGQWMKVGDVVGSSGNDQKVDFEGKNYDYVFDVDIQEGMPPLKLPFNANDNPYEAADAFLTRYELPAEYREEIVKFIIKNTGGVTLDQGDEPAISNVERKSKNALKVLPVKSYLSISNFNPDAIFNGLVKLNSKEKTFDDTDLAAIGSALHNVEESYELLFANASIIRSSWSNKVPSFDIMRLIVHKLPNADTMSEFIQEGLDPENPVLTMLTIRTLVNCFSNEEWGISLMSSKAVYESIFQTIDAEYPTCKPQQQSNLAVAVATLILNYSVLILLTNEIDVFPILADVLNNKFGPSAMCQNSEEAAYRLVVAYGNLSTIDTSLRQLASSVVWLKQIKSKYGHIVRFHDLFEDFVNL